MNAYRRWRLHNGTFQKYYEQHDREALIEFVSPWWNSWAQYWTVHIHGDGFCDLYSDIRTAKGSMKDETIEAIKAAILAKDEDKGLLDIIISRQDDNVENCGCIWTGNGLLHYESISDVVRWIIECERCEDETAYVEPSGFIYHLDKSLRKKSETDQSMFENFATNSAAKVSTVVKESMSHLAGLVHLSTFGYFGASRTSELADDANGNDGPSDDLTESRFLVGLEGGLEEEEVDKPLEPISTDTDLYTEMLSTDDREGPKTNFSYKKLFLRLSESPEPSESQSTPEQEPETGFFSEQYSVIIYRRRPFIFTLFYKPKSAALSNKAYYQSLHLRLASLTEPIYTDLTSEDRESSSGSASRASDAAKSKTTRSRSSSTGPKSGKAPKPHDFYYHVYDPNKHSVNSSLPDIPSLEYILELEHEATDDGTIAQKANFDRSELIHVHQSMSHISISCGHKGDREKFIRTARGWWIYWSKLPDSREVVFARRWNRPGKPPMGIATSGLLEVLGKDAKAWLDDYKYFGKV